MQTEFITEILERAQPANRIAFVVEPRRERSDPDLTVDDADNAAADPAFCRHAHIQRPMA